MSKKVIHVVGARPNFMKAAPVVEALAGRTGIEQVLVHTGQHYDENMSRIFFSQLEIPKPDVNLEVGSASHAVMTANIMTSFETVIQRRRPDLVLVYGDVNSTIACALVAVKMGVAVGHVEAGLRAFDRTMPEEINRVLTDAISDYYFTPSEDANLNLRKEGVRAGRIFFIGNCMIDTLLRLSSKARRPGSASLEDRFILVTLHRPSNVDNADMLRQIVRVLKDLSREVQVVFPIHPRTRRQAAGFGIGLEGAGPRFLLTEPLGYLEFLWLQKNAVAVVTDSGGVQEETTALGIPCFTLRPNTERPITCSVGTNKIVGGDLELLRKEIGKSLRGEGKTGRIPPFWDGGAGRRIAEVIEGLELGGDGSRR